MQTAPTNLIVSSQVAVIGELSETQCRQGGHFSDDLLH